MSVLTCSYVYFGICTVGLLKTRMLASVQLLLYFVIINFVML